jgi:hypothetical protein
MNALNSTDMIPNLTSTNVLPLPPESIPNPILEPNPTIRIPNNQIPSPLEQITLLEHIP